jgi:phosphatidylglycerophosphate synthase
MDHVREHRSVLAAAEKRLLIAIAARLPRFVTSDHLTLLGLVAMPAAAIAFARIPAAPWSAALFALALLVNWLGDSLDGTLARVRNQQRPRYGYYVDHVIDLFGTAVLVGGMAASGLMHAPIAIALVAAYFAVSAESFLATHALSVFRISFAGFGPTELRLILIAGACAVARDPWIDAFAGSRVLLLDVGGLVAIAGLVGAFAVSAIRNTRALYLAEPLPATSDCHSSAGRAYQRHENTKTENTKQTIVCFSWFRALVISWFDTARDGVAAREHERDVDDAGNVAVTR